MAFIAEAGGYCIDRSEVTQAQFKSFLDVAPTLVTPSGETEPVCAGHTLTAPHPNVGDSFEDCPSFTPYRPLETPDLPVVCLEWCDAFKFCQAAGKRLCSGLEGMTIALQDAASTAKQNEWVRACAGAELSRFPYGSEFDADACAATETQAVATQECTEELGGVHDLVGNVAEWTNECRDEVCIVRGGSVADVGGADPRSALACTGAVERDTGTRDIFVGFRCCADRAD